MTTHLRTLLTASIFVASATVASAQTAQDLWPVHSGDEWTYEISGATNNGQKFDVKVTQRSGGWARIEGVDHFYGAGWDDRWWWMSSSTGRIWVWNDNAGTYSRVFDLSAGLGNSFVSRMIDGGSCQDGSTWEVKDESATVQTRIGTMQGCVIIENVAPVCADAGLTRMIFAPGVGLVEYSWTTIAGPHTAQVSHALVDGVEYREVTSTFAGGISVSLSIDQGVYRVVDDREPPAEFQYSVYFGNSRAFEIFSGEMVHHQAAENNVK